MKFINSILMIFLMFVTGYPKADEKLERQFFKQGEWEFGFSANIGGSNKKTKTTSIHEYNDGTQPSTYAYENNEKGIHTHLGISAGYYIIDGLSIEPELNLNFNFEGFSVSILGNLCYTFYFPRKNIFPYLKLGYGMNNNGDSSTDLFESLEFNTINVGAGLKLMYFPSMALKMELNYRNINGSHTYSYSDQYTSSSSKYETTTSILTISVGISILI